MKKVVFIALLIVVGIILSTNLIDKIQYRNLSEKEKQIYDLIEEQKVINANYVEDIEKDIVKLIPIDLENPVLANGDVLDIKFVGEVGSGEEVSVNVEFGIVSFERGLGICDDFKIYTISESEEILYILFTSSMENDDDYMTTIFNYDPNKGNVFGMIDHVGSALYYDNKDNIIFWSYGLKAKGFREDIPLELKYHYNISQEVRRKIIDEEILDILKL